MFDQFTFVKNLSLFLLNFTYKFSNIVELLKKFFAVLLLTGHKGTFLKNNSIILPETKGQTVYERILEKETL